jgi:hypothetical protein
MEVQLMAVDRHEVCTSLANASFESSLKKIGSMSRNPALWVQQP